MCWSFSEIKIISIGHPLCVYLDVALSNLSSHSVKNGYSWSGQNIRVHQNIDNMAADAQRRNWLWMAMRRRFPWGTI